MNGDPLPPACGHDRSDCTCCLRMDALGLLSLCWAPLFQEVKHDYSHFRDGESEAAEVMALV